MVRRMSTNVMTTSEMFAMVSLLLSMEASSPTERDNVIGGSGLRNVIGAYFWMPVAGLILPGLTQRLDVLVDCSVLLVPFLMCAMDLCSVQHLSIVDNMLFPLSQAHRTH